MGKYQNPKNVKGPQFLDYIMPIIEVLKENGGSGNASEIIDKVIDKLSIPEGEVEKKLPSGNSSVRNRIQWARFYLAKAGFIETGKRGFWQLTNEGYEIILDKEKIYILFRSIHKEFEITKSKTKKESPVDLDNEIVEDETHGVLLLNTLKTLTPEGFERICKRLLTEIGIQEIIITGKSGDQGIDGIGIIKLNDVVNFNIVFQCKKYQDTVSSNHVREFRGSMQGRADKGLILTTGRFTAEAKKEASRDGVPPIELIDGERLVALFEKYQLGLKPVIIYEIVPEFFNNFNHT